MGGAHTTSLLLLNRMAPTDIIQKIYNTNTTSFRDGCFMVLYFKDIKDLRYFGKRIRGL